MRVSSTPYLPQEKTWHRLDGPSIPTRPSPRPSASSGPPRRGWSVARRRIPGRRRQGLDRYRTKRAWGTLLPAPSQPEAHPRAATTAGDRAAPPHPGRGVHRCAACTPRRCTASGASGTGRLDHSKPLRYEREKPAACRRQEAPRSPTAAAGALHGRSNAGPRQRAGWRYVHSAIDDRTRLGYSEIHTNETGFTAAGFWRRAAPSMPSRGSRELTVYRSRLPHRKDTRTSPRRTRPYRPQTNGKVRFHRRNGPTPATGTTTPNAAAHQRTTTMNTGPTEPSNGTPMATLTRRGQRLHT